MCTNEQINRRSSQVSFFLCICLSLDVLRVDVELEMISSNVSFSFSLFVCLISIYESTLRQKKRNNHYCEMISHLIQVNEFMLKMFLPSMNFSWRYNTGMMIVEFGRWFFSPRRRILSMSFLFSENREYSLCTALLIVISKREREKEQNTHLFHLCLYKQSNEKRQIIPLKASSWAWLVNR